jgi:hypothetical protein
MVWALYWRREPAFVRHRPRIDRAKIEFHEIGSVVGGLDGACGVYLFFTA